MSPIEETVDVEAKWKPTKTPKKRALAVKRRLAFLQAVYNATEGQWSRISMRKLGRTYGINSAMAFLFANGIVERNRRKYRWRGPAPTEELAVEWCDVIMTYTRRRRNRKTTLKREMVRTFNSLRTADSRADKIENALHAIYRSIRFGYRKVGLTHLCISSGLPTAAGRHLINKGCVDRPIQGRCKWIGPPPDRELALWLFGMLCEHHRTIYRSALEKKRLRTELIDNLIGRMDDNTTTEVPVSSCEQVQDSLDQPISDYWSQPSRTW